ncbi:hypothetical protein [Flavihumibacter petaseus]|uniref:PIN domain-containing protein n=1 Tax=Flavihumibacter petaseus NBRC 106054 TaxID=1220578 RepID=A0A0E9MXR4_9BACT|nr:hypothetical protein [Flavihumibacter petaseus]GAO42303.1 hypothetical protein FPE01S_01_13160 [Flavihumibacter petaseus NBRC 106054]
MKRVAIQDANILIDLIKIDLFTHCIELEFLFSTTQLVFETELNDHQVKSLRRYIESGKFTIIEISEVELLEIQLMGEEDGRLSLQDWSTLYYSQKTGALLLSGDRVLRKVSEAKGIEVCGVLWIFDQLVGYAVISSADAHRYLNELMKHNKRLPAAECQRRLDDWSK